MPDSLWWMALIALATLTALALGGWVHRYRKPRPRAPGRRLDEPRLPRRGLPKPAWVRHELLRLKAMNPEDGCRKLADTFNRQFAPRALRVGKTFVSDLLRSHHHEIAALRRQVRNRRLRAGPSHHTWGLDLTGKGDATGAQHPILGLIDHGTRACLDLQALPDKRSITLLIQLLKVIERFGRPRRLRTDNEAVFNTGLFRVTLRLLGIRHQRIDPHCPWQNGRVERLFGTLKHKIDRWQVPDFLGLTASLGEFRTWYNHIRPHQHLEGRTPAEVWNGTDVYTRRSRRVIRFEAWDGLLTGHYLPP